MKNKNDHLDSDLYREKRQIMVARQLESRGIKDKLVLDAFLEISRHIFVPIEYKEQAYEDHPLPIGFGQTISQPYIVAYMTEKLCLTRKDKVLEIGTGSGYQAAILSKIAGVVHTVERIPELAVRAKNLLRSLRLENVFVHKSDGSVGWESAAPYDAILVTAAAPKVPQMLLDQLAFNGRMIIPVGSRWRQVLELWQKKEQGFDKEEVLPVVFVPLKGEHGWGDGDW